MSTQRALTAHPAPANVVPIDRDEREEREQMARDLIYRGASDAQLKAVLAICRRYRWDPLLKPIALISNQMYVTVAALLHTAHASGQFDGLDVTSELHADGKWLATATVWRKDMRHPVVVRARQKEYDKGSPVWKSSPAAMTETRALSRALRYAFSIGLTGAEEVGYDPERPDELPPIEMRGTVVSEGDWRPVDEPQEPARPPAPSATGVKVSPATTAARVARAGRAGADGGSVAPGQALPPPAQAASVGGAASSSSPSPTPEAAPPSDAVSGPHTIPASPSLTVEQAVAVLGDESKRADYRMRAARYALRESGTLEELTDVWAVVKAQGDALEQDELEGLYNHCVAQLDIEGLPF